MVNQFHRFEQRLGFLVVIAGVLRNIHLLYRVVYFVLVALKKESQQ